MIMISKEFRLKKQKVIAIKKLTKAVKMSYKNEFYNILYFSIENEKIELEYGDCDTCWISFDDVISDG